MRLPAALLIPIGAFVSLGALGQQGMFLEKYRAQIQNYIMTGNAGESKDCDILSGSTFLDATPQISMDLDKLKTMNIKSAFASSRCVLVNYHVDGIADIQALLKFGMDAADHVRIALVLKMRLGLTLDMVTNTTKLPFLVAAELGQAKEQFLCPVVGEVEPRLEQVLCPASYVSYSYKTLRIGLLGIRPDFIFTNNGNFDGINIRLMNILKHRFNFMSEIIIPQSFQDANLKVCTLHW